MKLRSCAHSHFVQALRRGVVEKVLNLRHGRPALKFRAVIDLYENEDAKLYGVKPTLRPKFECVDLPVECDSPRAESSCTLTGDAQNIKSDDETSESKSQINVAEESGLGDLNFANITLKQIKERCREKKRKRSKNVNTSKETTETCSPGKRSCISSQSEDEYDSMEPLSCWKSRIMKKKKTKRKCKKNINYAASQNSLSIAHFEEMSTEFIFQREEDSSAPIAIKVELPDQSSECKALIVTCPESHLNCIEPVVYSKWLNKADGYDLETRKFSIEPHIPEHLLLGSGMPVIPVDQFIPAPCSTDIYAPSLYSHTPPQSAANEESFEELDIAESYASQTAVPEEELTTDTYGFETLVPALLTYEPHLCDDSNESYGNEDNANGNDIQGLGGKNLTDGDEVVRDQFSHFSLLEEEKEYSATEKHQINNFQVAPTNEDHTPVLCSDPQNFASSCMKSQKSSSNSEVQVPDATIDVTHEVKGPRNGNGAHLPNVEAEVHNHVQAEIVGSPARNCSSRWNSNLNSAPNCSFGSVVGCQNDSVVTMVEESHHSELQHPPERLLSNRMAISPTSQKKLREAMEANELDHEEYYIFLLDAIVNTSVEIRIAFFLIFSTASLHKSNKSLLHCDVLEYARKMCYRNLTESKIGRPEGGIQIKKAEDITSPKKAVKKSKTNNGLHHNDNIKVSHASLTVQNNVNGFNSARGCPESAILFSQQQLRDIELITARLTKELQCMKDIARETLQYPEASLRYSQNEIKVAIQNATRTEESAKRSLSIMARDCSRFCKIMTMAEKGSGTTSNMVRKKRKIVFADEAGGKLCDVKTFQNDLHCE